LCAVLIVTCSIVCRWSSSRSICHPGP